MQRLYYSSEMREKPSTSRSRRHENESGKGKEKEPAGALQAVDLKEEDPR